MASLGTLIYTKLMGQSVGEDDFGNVYYQSRSGLFKASKRRQKRWVLFKGSDEATKIPPVWHAWLHYTLDEPPVHEQNPYTWQKEHKQNMTGTAAAYRPQGHTLKDGPRAKAVGDYEPWTPGKAKKEKRV